MILEVVEQRCLDYLKQISHPLAPIHAVLRYVREDEKCADTTEQGLIAFLRKHELFRVIEPEPPGIMSVILETRLPSESEMKALMNDQLSNMTDALAKALREAEARGDEVTAARITKLLERARTLHDEMGHP